MRKEFLEQLYQAYQQLTSTSCCSIRAFVDRFVWDSEMCVSASTEGVDHSKLFWRKHLWLSGQVSKVGGWRDDSFHAKDWFQNSSQASHNCLFNSSSVVTGCFGPLAHAPNKYKDACTIFSEEPNCMLSKNLCWLAFWRLDKEPVFLDTLFSLWVWSFALWQWIFFFFWMTSS